jgi:hypothetical protein
VINAQDGQFGALQVWQDLNQDGISQSNELHSLTELGIESISTSSETANQNLNGNLLSSVGSYTMTDGTVGTTGSLLFGTSTFYTDFTEPVEIPPEIQSLPNMKGSGLVRDLRESAALSSSVATTLEMYSNAATRDEQLSMLGELLYAWSGSSGMQSMAERALSAGYVVEYQFGSIQSEDASSYADGYSFSSGTSNVAAAQQTFANDYLSNQSQDYQHWHRIISILERFNGEEFIIFAEPDPVNAEELTLSIDPDQSGGGGGSISINRIRVVLSNSHLGSL